MDFNIDLSFIFQVELVYKLAAVPGESDDAPNETTSSVNVK